MHACIYQYAHMSLCIQHAGQSIRRSHWLSRVAFDQSIEGTSNRPHDRYTQHISCTCAKCIILGHLSLTGVSLLCGHADSCGVVVGRNVDLGPARDEEIGRFHALAGHGIHLRVWSTWPNMRNESCAKLQ